MQVVKIEQVTAEIWTFADGSQKIAFDLPRKIKAPEKLSTQAVINLLAKLTGYTVETRKQYTAIAQQSAPRKNALYIVETKDGLAISIHKDILPITDESESDKRFPSTSRRLITSKSELADLIKEIKPSLRRFLK
jgi:hypothetical protein